MTGTPRPPAGTASAARPEAAGTRAAAGPKTPAAAVLASLLGVSVCLLDTNIVNVAIPDIQHALGGTLGDSQWIVSLYVLALAALIVPAGVLGDLHDIRVCFGIGALVFGLGSGVCALAGAGWQHALAVIFVGRLVQGVGAALALPLSLAMLFVYGAPGGTGRLIALWSAVGGLSTAVGPLVGGVLVQWLGWAWIFLLNLPVVVVLVVVTTRVPAPTAHRRERLPRPASVAAFGVSTFALTLAVIQGPQWGWSGAPVLGAFALSLLAGVAFVLLERGSDRPLLPSGLRRGPAFRISLVTGLGTGLSAFAFLFFLSYYLQYGAGLGPVATGLRFLPMSAMLVLFSGAGRMVCARLGVSRGIGVGMLVCAVGLAALWFALAGRNPGTLATIAPTMVIGAGVGISFPATSAQALAGASEREYGTAASALMMSRQLGNSIGVCLLGLVMTHWAGQAGHGERQGLRWIGVAAAAVAAVVGLLNLMGGNLPGGGRDRAEHDSEGL